MQTDVLVTDTDGVSVSVIRAKTADKTRREPRMLPIGERFAFLIELCNRELKNVESHSGENDRDKLSRSYNRIMQDAKRIQTQLESEKHLTFGYKFAAETTQGLWDDELLHDLKTLYPMSRMKNKPVPLDSGHTHHVHATDRGKRFLGFIRSEKGTEEARQYRAIVDVMRRVLDQTV